MVVLYNIILSRFWTFDGVLTKMFVLFVVWKQFSPAACCVIAEVGCYENSVAYMVYKILSRFFRSLNSHQRDVCQVK